MAPTVKPIQERFWKLVEKTDTCWLWVGTKDKDGYGKVWFMQTQARAHRVSWFLAHGIYPRASRFICHTCDVPACVNPAHLYIGDSFTNNQDTVKRGRRNPHGLKNK